MRRTLEERFWVKVDRRGDDECWPWLKSQVNGGYGQFRVAGGESPKRASRVAWQLTHGDPGALSVLHSCDNPPCCNPAHLFLGTTADNNADKIQKGRENYNMEALVARVRRLTDEQIREARQRYAAGESCRSIGNAVGVAHTTISRLVGGKHWSGSAT